MKNLMIILHFVRAFLNFQMTSDKPLEKGVGGSNLQSQAPGRIESMTLSADAFSS